MKNQVELMILLFFELAFLVYLFPFVFVEAAKFQSGVTINQGAPPAATTCVDNNHDGFDDSNPSVMCGQAGQTQTCGLEIVSGVPINYGQLNLAQDSADQQVTLKNDGTVTANVMVKGGSWISDAAGNPAMSGPEITHVSVNPNTAWAIKKPLGTNELQLGQLSSQQTKPVFFQLKVPASGFSGSLQQEVTIDLIC
ncbi:MAG: hypothetical protein E6K94_11455 [Thaumarchaeota archaeon]|nr:MAG: hypothetical protein E6K94_11455 [Nitrososphaerota archaeon]